MSENIERAPRVPPNDPVAERAVLSSMLYEKEAVSAAYDLLKPDDFYRTENKLVYEAMIEMFQRSEPIDVVTLSDKLTEKGVLDQIGGRAFIIELASGAFTSANVKFYSRIVEEKALLRRLIKASNDILASSYAATDEVETILAGAEKSIFNISQRRGSDDFAELKDILVQSIDSIEEISKNKGKITGIPTGFYDLDQKTAGLQKSDLILIGARPSMGKTAFMLNVAQYVAVSKRIPTAFFSLEMSKELLVNRLICSEAGVDSQKLRNGELNDDDWVRIAQSISPLSNAPLYFDDTPGITVMELRAKCRKLKLEKGLGLIIIDYLQLMGSTGRSENRQQEVSEISRSLKAVAKELQAPVVVAAQLSRAPEARTNHRPMLSDLRESGSIEQDADVVAFLYRDEYYNPDTDKKNQAEVIIAKQRNGPTGTVELMYFGQYTRFANIDRGFK